MAENDSIDSTPHPHRQDVNRGPGAVDAPDAIGPSDDAQLPGGKVDGGSAGDRTAMNFDDDEIYSGRGNNARRDGTAHADGGDSGRLGPPSEQLSRTNGPSEKNS